jgi:hypothetical protein
MSRNSFAALIIGFAFVATAIPALAHHSETAEYDTTKPVKVDESSYLVLRRRKR